MAIHSFVEKLKKMFLVSILSHTNFQLFHQVDFISCNDLSFLAVLSAFNLFTSTFYSLIF